MKFRLTVKCPDAFDIAICTAAETTRPVDHSDAEWAEERPQVQADLSRFAGQWVKWGEVVEIEFDTVAGTATLIKQS